MAQPGPGTSTGYNAQNTPLTPPMTPNQIQPPQQQIQYQVQSRQQQNSFQTNNQIIDNQPYFMVGNNFNQSDSSNPGIA